jgi:hypothetical protein
MPATLITRDDRWAAGEEVEAGHVLPEEPEKVLLVGHEGIDWS